MDHIPEEPELHLLVAVFLRPQSLNVYRLGLIDRSSTDPLFRVSRFLTSLRSLSKTNWKTIDVYIGLHESFVTDRERIHNAIIQLLPSANVVWEPLECRQDWEAACGKFSRDAIVLLHSNDDHALICQDSNALPELARLMQSDRRYGMAAITHHPEFQGLVTRRRWTALRLSPTVRAFPTTYAVGTILLRADFLQSWWSPGKFSDTERIVRPDNPFGRSVSFEPMLMLVPNSEIMRHMDGYSHIWLYRPLAPLRNTVHLPPATGELVIDSDWSIGLWPCAIAAYRPSDFDIHAVTFASTQGPANLRSTVARIQAVWGFRISFSRLFEIADPYGDLGVIRVLAAAILALSTPVVLRNVPDWILDRMYLTSSPIMFRRWGRPVWPREVGYHGWTRFVMLRAANLRRRR